MVLALVLGGCEFVGERNKLASEKEAIAGSGARWMPISSAVPI